MFCQRINSYLLLYCIQLIHSKIQRNNKFLQPLYITLNRRLFMAGSNFCGQGIWENWIYSLMQFQKDRIQVYAWVVFEVIHGIIHVVNMRTGYPDKNNNSKTLLSHSSHLHLKAKRSHNNRVHVIHTVMYISQMMIDVLRALVHMTG